MEAIAIVQKAVPSRSTLAILDGILVEADETVKLTGYDLETGIECLMEADIREKGHIVVPSRMFGDIIRKLPEDIVMMEVSENGQITIDSGKTHFTIKGIAADGYPKIPVVDNGKAVSIRQSLLKDMIRQTIFAVSSDESRPTLNGCYLRCEGNQVEMVAIDGFRLALRRKTVEGDEVGTMSFIVPGRTLQEVVRVLESGGEQPVLIRPSGNHILFDMGDVKITSRLIQGEYMNYRGIIPQTADSTLVVSPVAMMDAIARASLIISSEDKRFPVRLSMSEDDTLVVTANTDIGTLREEIPVELTGNRIDIDFNPRYFLDALKVIDQETVTIAFNGSMGPCVMKPSEGSDFAYLVLPLRR